MVERPNIVLIMGDQISAPFLRAYGNKLAKTPNIDRIAENGVVFDNAYCNVPLCAPSRASLMTGKLCSEIGAYDNEASFPSDVPTMAHYLRAWGYMTALSGKMHYVGADLHHGLETRLTPELYSTGFDRTADWSTGDSGLEPDTRLFSDIGLARRTVQLDYDEEVGFRSVGFIYDRVREDDERPFFLISSFTHPHDPYRALKKHWDLYDHDDIDMPKVSIPAAEQDAHSKRAMQVYGIDLVDLDDEVVRNMRHAYYANLSYLDEKVGEILDALEDTDQLENTVILFAADHGDMLGERGLIQKKVFFEHAMRVPFFVWDPRAPANGASVNQQVSLVDLFPTILQIATGANELDLVEPLDGQGLMPWATGEIQEPTQPVFAEILSETTNAPLFMVVLDGWKYIYGPEDAPMLFNLIEDPGEQHNLAGLPDHSEAEAKMHAATLRRWDAKLIESQVRNSQSRRKLISTALSTGQRLTWDDPHPQTGKLAYLRAPRKYYDWAEKGNL